MCAYGASGKKLLILEYNRTYHMPSNVIINVEDESDVLDIKLSREFFLVNVQQMSLLLSVFQIEERNRLDSK